MTLKEFNQLESGEAKVELLKCCGSETWVDKMIAHIPFANTESLFKKANEVWYKECNKKDWREAFKYHPKIGDLESLKKKFTNTKKWAEGEQAGVNTASEDILERLAEVNKKYETTFGYIFIVCATGKSASEMLRLAEARLKNGPKEEIHIAKGEQHKITLIRLNKLITDTDNGGKKGSHLTTHVLDTSIGLPGRNIIVRLQHKRKKRWRTLTLGLTDQDGRIGDLLPSGMMLKPDDYKILFETGDYFENQNLKGFYPEVGIQFTVFDESHYHVPLLLNPFGYSTYRGS